MFLFKPIDFIFIRAITYQNLKYPGSLLLTILILGVAYFMLFGLGV